MFLTETIAGRQPDPIIFPKLGITVDPNPVAFTAFGKEIYWYGIIIAMGFLLAVLYMMYRAKDFGLTQDDVLDMVLWAVPIGVICARAYYCIFYWSSTPTTRSPSSTSGRADLPSTAASSAARSRCSS